MIDIKEVEKKFGQKCILSGVNLQIPSGNIIVLRGKNGSGKTTLVRIIANIIKKDNGDILIGSERINSKSYLYKRKVAFYLGTEILIENLTLIEYLSFVASLYNIPKNIFDNRLDKLIHFFDLPKKMLLRNFSKGMKTKAALCSAFIRDTEYLILDEPFENLDNDTIDNLLNCFLLLAQEGKGIFLTSHLKFEQDKFPHLEFILDNGKIFNTR